MKPWCRSLFAFALLASSLTAQSGPDSQCPVLPNPVPIQLDQVLILGDRGYIAHSHGTRRTSGGPFTALEIDLYIGVTDPQTGGIKRGSGLPGYGVNYRLSDAQGVISSGPLTFGLTPQGPAYGGSVPLPGNLDTEGPHDMELELEITEPPNLDGGPVQPKHGDQGCTIPLPSNMVATFDLADVLQDLHLDPLAETDGDGTNVRMTLLSQRDPVAPENYSNIWGWNNGTTYLAIIGNVPGTTFFDVTDPANPVQVGFIDGPDSSWREIKTYKNYAYIVTEGSGSLQGMQIVDLSNPLNPTLVNTYAVNFTTAHTVYIDEDKGHAYINGSNNNGSFSGMRIVSLEPDPVHPTEIGFWSTRYVHDCYVRNNRAFLSEINNGLQEVLDSTNPANLLPIASWNTPNSFTHNCWANQAQTLLVTTDETSNPPGYLAIYDISNLATGQKFLGRYVGDSRAIVHNAYFEDGDNQRVAMSYYGTGARLIDLHRPTYPVELGAYDTYPSGSTGFNGAWGMYNFDPRGYLYVSDIQTGLYVLRYDPTGGVVSGVIRDASNNQPVAGVTVVELSGGAAAVSGADGVFGLYAPAGNVQLRATAPGYQTSLVNAGNLLLDGRLDKDVNLSPLPRGPISGRVRRSDNQAGVPGALVTVAGLGMQTVSASDGSFTLADVPIGGRIVTAEAFGFASAESRVTLTSAGLSGLNIDVEPGRFVDDAETNRGWQLGGAPGDAATSGRWERVNPNGTGGGTIQPEDDHTPAPGVTAFITGQAAVGSPAESSDVDGGVTSLISPTINTSDLGAAQIGLHRWMVDSGGFFDGGQMSISVSADGGTNWTTMKVIPNGQAAWIRESFDLGSFASLTAQTRVRVQAQPNTPYANAVLEGGVDDFEIVRACRSRFNSAQLDRDGDGAVDPCDSCSRDGLDDVDGDTICGDVDNAPFTSNTNQVDADADGVGDAADNCGGLANSDQRDLDRDNLGDLCDGDVDGDGVTNALDTDRDNDSVLDASDNCVNVPNARQLNRDGDSLGDACDTDDGEVAGVRLTGARVLWEKELDATGYNLYRGDLGAAALVPLAACKVADLRTAYGVDLDQPNPGDGFFYLISRRTATSEGPLGRSSSGVERLITVRCP